ncbi:MAG: AarF/UbiB family protein [Thermoleophilia bacterium]|nr:AarF/UbiB family protein [Thermoleophilia bacterium]
MGKLSGRLLGVRLGRWRGVLVGLIGWAAGATAAALALSEETPGGGREVIIDSVSEAVAAVSVVVFFGVLAAMPVAIAIDLVTPRQPRRRRRSRLLHPVRATKAALAPYGRLREVVGNARRENLLSLRYASRSALESPDLSHRLRVVIEESGGMLVKFGQIASTRTDLLPGPLTDELARLRSDVQPVGAESVRGVIESELGEPVERAFASFEWQPLAAASVGQTHRAALSDGTRVVVKVQRPGIGDLVVRDAAVMRLVARQLERRVEAARAIGMRGLTEELIAGVEQELDYLHEASVGTRLRENRKADVGIAVPAVHATLSTDRVLVMEEVVGRPVDDIQALDASPVPRPEIARRLLSSFLGQVLEDGLYHADPHPGNMLIDEAGTVWLLDFGAVGRLDRRALDGLRGIALGVASGDAGVLARAARDLAGDRGLADLRALEADMAASLGTMEAGGIDPALIADLLNVMSRHELRPPASMTLLARALLTLEGTLRIIEPGFSIQQASKALVMEQHRDAFGTPQELLQKEALRTLPAVRTLPEHAEALANQLRAGRLTVRTERYAGGDRLVVDSWIDRITLALIGGATVVSSGLMMLAAAATGSGSLRIALWILGFAGLSCGAVVLMRGAAQALRRQSARLD